MGLPAAAKGTGRHSTFGPALAGDKISPFVPPTGPTIVLWLSPSSAHEQEGTKHFFILLRRWLEFVLLLFDLLLITNRRRQSSSFIDVLFHLPLRAIGVSATHQAFSAGGRPPPTRLARCTPARLRAAPGLPGSPIQSSSICLHRSRLLQPPACAESPRRPTSTPGANPFNPNPPVASPPFTLRHCSPHPPPPPPSPQRSTATSATADTASTAIAAANVTEGRSPDGDWQPQHLPQLGDHHRA